jgi:hypothetical protein
LAYEIWRNNDVSISCRPSKWRFGSRSDNHLSEKDNIYCRFFTIAHYNWPTMKACSLQVSCLILLPVMFLAGCSGSSSTSGGTTPPAETSPAVTSISPTSAMAGSGSLTLTVNGSGFLTTTTVQVGGVADVTSYVSSTQVTATVTPQQLTSGTQLSVIALNGTASSGSGAAVNLEVTNPVPAITQFTPATLATGSASPTVAVTGTGFVPTTVIDVNGSARPTTFVSSTQVNVTLTASDVVSAGSLSLTAVNATPGGGTSAASAIAINNPAPGAVIALSPAVVMTGGASPVTVTVTGTNFIPASTVQVNGAARATSYVNPTQLTFLLTATDQATAQLLPVTVVNPTPGGGTSLAATLEILTQTPTPVITQVTPSQLITGSGATYIYVYGSGLYSQLNSGQYVLTSSVLWNGTPLTVVNCYIYGNGTGVDVAEVPANLLTSAGTATITVSSSTSTPAVSNALTVTIANPPAPTLTSISPNAGPINTAAAVTLYGTGFTASSTVALNGANIAATYVSSTELTASIPASSIALPGNVNFTVTTPAPGGGTTAPLTYTAYLAIANNDIVYNTTDGLLYASIPVSGLGSGGNSVAGIDPVTGTVMRQIWVGSNPNKLALSTDGTQLFVGLDGAGAVAQVNLSTGTVVNQFSLGGGPGIYNPPYTANYLAAIPGSPDSVAVASAGSFDGGTGVTIYDSGVPRAKSSSGVGYGPLSFGSSSSILYMAGTTIEQLAVGSSGITGATPLASASGSVTSIQYDNGQLYLSTGQVFNASTGALLGTFYSSGSTPATGPIVSDSTLGEAFVGVSNYSSSGQVLAFNETSFNSTGSVTVNGVGTDGYPTNFQKIVRWGQNGLALSAAMSSFASVNQIFIFQSPLVKDLSTAPADLSVTLTAPGTAATGTAISWVAKISNNGPNQAQGATLAMNLDSSLIINSVTPSQGSCGTGAEFICDLGSMANGTSATVTVSATPSTSGTLAGAATVSSTSYDPTTTNNQATTSTVVSGSLYGAVPLLSAISPNFIQAGSSDFTLTVTGIGFNEESTVNLGSTPLTTTYTSATQLTATVSASQIANYGWAAVTVANPAPGGGVSQVLPLTIYAVVNVPASGILFEPYSQQLYATVPSNATSMTGNSVVTINPFTTAVGTPVPVGSQPTVMAETADGNYLYIGLSGSNSLAQFNLLNQSLQATIPLSYTQSGSTNSVATSWLAAMPGTDTTLAMNFTNAWGNFGIFDISGSTGSFRSNLSGIYEGVDPVFADATHIYAYDSQTSGAEFYRYSVNANGLTLIDGTTLDGMGGFSGSIELAGSWVYGAGGGIINPATTPPSQITTLPLFDFYASGINGEGVAVAADPSLQKEFLMMVNTAGTWAYGLARYDLATYRPEALLDMPASANSVEAKWTMLRFGQDGLALLSSGENYSTDPATTVTVLMLVRGPFVAPQLMNVNSAANLTSSSVTSITHGAGNTLLTLTGSNFVPGVAVTWNGSYRTTTIVDATHVTVAIPASDLSGAGSGTLIAMNPGATGSNALTVTIN